MSDEPLWWDITCPNGSSGAVQLKRLPPEDGGVTDNYCNSAACPQKGGATGGAGSCGTDCDCGECWYCESGSCYYGGQGPTGACYRGCQ